MHSEILSLGESRCLLLMLLALLVILEAGIAVVGSPLLLFRSGVTVEHGGAKATLLVLASLLRCGLAVWSFGILYEAFRQLM